MSILKYQLTHNKRFVKKSLDVISEIDWLHTDVGHDNNV